MRGGTPEGRSLVQVVVAYRVTDGGLRVTFLTNYSPRRVPPLPLFRVETRVSGGGETSYTCLGPSLVCAPVRVSVTPFLRPFLPLPRGYYGVPSGSPLLPRTPRTLVGRVFLFLGLVPWSDRPLLRYSPLPRPGCCHHHRHSSIPLVSGSPLFIGSTI